jgi:DNA primase
LKLTFPDEFIKQVKDGNDIIEVASDYFTLTKSGDLYKTRCKHRGGDKTPSLTFFVKTQSFYCFGCHAGKRDGKTEGSDVISFIQWMENIDWQEAVMLLAKRIGMKSIRDLMKNH